MTDTVSRETRARIMRQVRSKDTAPEMLVRRIAHGLGFRFRLHRPDLPGKPDLTFPVFRSIIFVHGCFWHRHDCPAGSKHPKTNAVYWSEKISHNVARDARHLAELRDDGWAVLVIWECETRNQSLVAARIAGFLGRPARPTRSDR